MSLKNCMIYSVFESDIVRDECWIDTYHISYLIFHPTIQFRNSNLLGKCMFNHIIFHYNFVFLVLNVYTMHTIYEQFSILKIHLSESRAGQQLIYFYIHE